MLLAYSPCEHLTAAWLRERYKYDPETGVFINLARPGKPIGALTDRGYVSIAIAGRGYRAHRLAWLYMTGEWPTHQIDHIDGNRANNSFSNLRDVPGYANKQNTKKQSNNTSGYTGVYLHKPSGLWCARIKHRRDHRYQPVQRVADGVAA